MINNVNSVANRPRRILVVDDDVDVVSTFKLILEMNGFEVDAYTNPALALSGFEPNSYGLLLA
ncbi:hypothetical protein BH18THE2_BH18THE2_31410 [soil metagenome]